MYIIIYITKNVKLDGYGQAGYKPGYVLLPPKAKKTSFFC